MPPLCDIAESPAFPNPCHTAANAKVRAWQSLAATVNPGDDEPDDEGNIEPDDDDEVGDDEDDKDEEPLWALRCCSASIPHRRGQPSYCNVTTRE
jgi:hypothetical protein